MNDRAKELVNMVGEIRTACPDMLMSHAIYLAHASLQSVQLDDAIIVLGDIADALNDMRPMAPGGRSMH